MRQSLDPAFGDPAALVTRSEIYSAVLLTMAFVLAAGAAMLALGIVHVLISVRRGDPPPTSKATVDAAIAALVSEVEGLHSERALTHAQVEELKRQAAAIDPFRDLSPESVAVLRGRTPWAMWSVVFGFLGLAVALASTWYAIVNS